MQEFKTFPGQLADNGVPPAPPRRLPTSDDNWLIWPLEPGPIDMGDLEVEESPGDQELLYPFDPFDVPIGATNEMGDLCSREIQDRSHTGPETVPLWGRGILAMQELLIYGDHNSTADLDRT